MKKKVCGKGKSKTTIITLKRTYKNKEIPHLEIMVSDNDRTIKIKTLRPRDKIIMSAKIPSSLVAGNNTKTVTRYYATKEFEISIRTP